MNETLTRLVRPDLRDLAGYSAASPDRDFVRLHANELPYSSITGLLNRYPEPQPAELIERLAALYGVAPRNVLATRGSDDAIDLLVRCFCRAGEDSIVVCPPTFGMYEVAARLQNAAVVRVGLDAANGFALREQAVVEACTENTRLVFLCSPNNPTGNLIDVDSVRRLCATLSETALVVVDEAYVEFAESESLAPLVGEYGNLVVLRTLSKAYGLAGARCGALVATPELIDMVRPAMPPYALPTPTIDAAIGALADASLRELERRIVTVRSEREQLCAQLDTLPIVLRTWPSEGNFVLAQIESVKPAIAACREQGMLIRDFSGYPGLGQHVRITVGKPAENQRLIAILGALF